ncbi:hypothetical protein H5119_07575 [Pseudoalteromonas sp. SG45-5]|uniref:hypothetical protein n=1 Tax=unclassified Pseudoalteromonas TaxID=194690 RepID=UPI0015FD834F|nr:MULTISPECIES: hypothetical protein [unclassified Pseudoalteromonas]MBB1385394.1 hypothetical protein [Pseudoalteromonas sp. SG45-5]MBB1393320.1 hypothetical protein [Pseudoalteromonas sp. SG44-4]MBB1449356.1 hypothetical protein [Pseudoalteromonas sp. SG41-6]
MTTITEFDTWLDAAGVEGHEEVYALHWAVSNREEMGMYKCDVNNGRYFITADGTDDTLMLASDKALHAFLSKVESCFGISDFGDIEGWYAYSRAMSKDD